MDESTHPRLIRSKERNRNDDDPVPERILDQGPTKTSGVRERIFRDAKTSSAGFPVHGDFPAVSFRTANTVEPTPDDLSCGRQARHHQGRHSRRQRHHSPAGRLKTMANRAKQFDASLAGKKLFDVADGRIRKGGRRYRVDFTSLSTRNAYDNNRTTRIASVWRCYRGVRLRAG